MSAWIPIRHCITIYALPFGHARYNEAARGLDSRGHWSLVTQCGEIGLQLFSQHGGISFSSSFEFDFGARVRDYGFTRGNAIRDCGSFTFLNLTAEVATGSGPWVSKREIFSRGAFDRSGQTRACRMCWSRR